MAQLTRQSLMGVAMRLYRLFTGRVAVVTSRLTATDIQIECGYEATLIKSQAGLASSKIGVEAGYEATSIGL